MAAQQEEDVNENIDENEDPYDVSFFDSVPVISQIKSFVQWVGDANNDDTRARQTQINFSRTCPVVAQVRCIVEAAIGDRQAAKKTHRVFAKVLKRNGGAFVNGVPVVGHIKGGVHYALGDKESGNAAMKSASRTVGVVLGAVGGTVVGGPVGGVLGAVAAGAAVDGLTTGIESGVNGHYVPSGTIACVTNIVNSEDNPGQVFDALAGLTATVALDAVGGNLAGRAPGAVGVVRTAGALTAGQVSGAASGATRRTNIRDER